MTIDFLFPAAKPEAFDPGAGCIAGPAQRLFILPDGLAARLASVSARAGDDAEAPLLDLVELGLDELDAAAELTEAAGVTEAMADA